ncbi:hypothetical protein QBC39DRAFT_246714 [Podospora conica]|nr:hypothetical protein QBC39DRAFT_246714 [Schizothecium conicum]
MSADTTSSLYPQRPIRPLPKRKLRERLAPGIAESIQYPPTPQNATPLFQYPYPLRDDDVLTADFAQDRTAQAERHSSRRNGGAHGSDGENSASRQSTQNRTGSDSAGRPARASLRPLDAKYANSQHHPSAASSVDGYDLLENTNNKKKRKIPAAAEAALAIAHDALEASSGSSSNTVSDVSGAGQSDTSASTSSPYYAPGNFASGAQNIPGPGRGRYGRPRTLRPPLMSLSDSGNNLAGRTGKIRASHWMPGTSENTGIISSAIANAEKLSAQKGTDNQSLLQQPLSGKRSSATTQFTFTCDSQVPGTLAWPGSASDRRGGPSANQTSTRAPNESWAGGHQIDQFGRTFGRSSPTSSLVAEMSAQETLSSGSGNLQNQPAPDAKISRRRMDKMYLEAARARERKTKEANRRHPPEDIWICEFCEYESIFGRPAYALIRQYEIKDRKQKEQEEQRRAQRERLRKGKHKVKKNSKAPVKTGNATQGAHPAGEAGEVGETDGSPTSRNYFQDTQEDEDLFDNDEEYEEGDDDPDDLPPLVGSPDPPGVVPTPSGGVSAPGDQGGT